jgi:calcineurin-like phosphoesterase family protein
MSKNIFFISDTHFGHDAMYRFLREDGTKVRNFDSAAVADEHMIAQWNSVVRPGDRVYHLGDIAMKAAFLPILERLNGRIILIRGNHDIFKLKQYVPYVDDVRGTHKIDNILLSHYPIHPHSIPRWCVANVHGHVHTRNVHHKIFNFRTPFADRRYFNVSVENINYTPIAYEDLRLIVGSTLRGKGED